MIFPTVHINGTSKQELIRQWEDVLSNLQQSLKALKDAVPHGRDYYPQGPNVIFEAVREHEDTCHYVALSTVHAQRMLEYLNKMK